MENDELDTAVRIEQQLDRIVELLAAMLARLEAIEAAVRDLNRTVGGA